LPIFLSAYGALKGHIKTLSKIVRKMERRKKMFIFWDSA
jgi:hypothetical protein